MRSEITDFDERIADRDGLLLVLNDEAHHTHDEESEWKGHVQLLASNRVCMFNFKHSFQDPTLISDLEHLDPYRAEQTHLRFFQILRSQLGNKINLIKHTLNAKRY